MKKTSLFSIALLLSATIFAQTSVKNSEAIKDNASIQSNKTGSQLNSSASVSSNTNIQSDAAHKAKSKTFAEIQKEKKAAVATKNKAKSQARLTAKESKKIISKDATVSTHSNTSINASVKGNNISNNTSFKNGTTLSSSRTRTNAPQIKDEGKAVVIAKTDETMKNGHYVATDINKSTIKEGNEVKAKGNEVKATSTSGVQSKTVSVQTIKPRPVSIKTSTLVRANGGIKLK